METKGINMENGSSTLKVKFKKLNELATMPKYSNIGDAGLDLTAVSLAFISDPEQCKHYLEYGTGLAVEIPAGYVGLLFPRSSISNKALFLANSVGVVDQSFRGEIKLRFKVDSVGYDGAVNDNKKPAAYNVGDRIGQLIIIPFPQIEIEEASELSSTERGEGGFGSTGQ